MVIEYKISFENGTVLIHQRVEPDAPSPQPNAESNSAGGVTLPITFPAGSAAVSGGGNTPPAGLGGGNTPPAGLGGGNTPPAGLGGGTEQGQIVVFGPIVIDASGLLSKNGFTLKTNTGESETKTPKPE